MSGLKGPPYSPTTKTVVLSTGNVGRLKVITQTSEKLLDLRDIPSTLQISIIRHQTKNKFKTLPRGRGGGNLVYVNFGSRGAWDGASIGVKSGETIMSEQPPRFSASHLMQSVSHGSSWLAVLLAHFQQH